MRFSISLLVAFFLFATLTGCASDLQTQQADAGPHAECLVCKMNADLACVDVAVTDRTPHCTYEGKEYYFCSTHCRDKFLKEPGKYLAKK